MKNLILDKIKKPFILIEFNNNEFKLIKKCFNKSQKIYYYYSEFKKLKNYFIENKRFNHFNAGLSFFIQNNKIGISFFANFFIKNEKVFTLESFKKNNFNLKVKYFKLENINNNLILNCRFYENDKPKRKENIKIFW